MGMSSSTSQTQGREERMITLTLDTDLEEFKHKEVTFYNIGPCFCVLEKRQIQMHADLSDFYLYRT